MGLFTRLSRFCHNLWTFHSSRQLCSIRYNHHPQAIMMQARRSLDGRRMYFASHTSTRACIMFHGDSIRFDIITLDNSSSCLMHGRLPSKSIDQHKLSISRPPRSRPLSLPVDHDVVERQACAASHRCRSIRICVRRLVLGRRPADTSRDGSGGAEKGGKRQSGWVSGGRLWSIRCFGERWTMS